MARTLLVHILNEDAVVGEVDELPTGSDQFLTLRSPRLRDGREVPYLLPETNVVLYPWNRIMSVEILPTESDEEIVTFIRE
jgi:hypothetical protein